jgi:hypothetical protein
MIVRATGLRLAALPLFADLDDAERAETLRATIAARGSAKLAIMAVTDFDTKVAAVRAVATDELDLVGIAVRAPHKVADGILRGLKRHT